MKKLKLNTMYILCSVLSVCLILLGSIYYIFNVQNSIWMQAVTDILEATEQGGHAFEVYIYKDREILSALASSLSQYNSYDSDSINYRLKMFGDEDANYIVVNLEKGVSYSNRSSEDKILTEKQLEQYKNLSDKGIFEPYISIYTGHNMIGYYQSFTFNDGVKAIVQKGQMIASVSEEFSLSFYDESGYSYIIDTDGEILVRSNNKNSNRTYPNIFDIIDNNENNPEAIAMFREGLEQGKKGVARFMVEDEKKIFAYVPVKNTDGWYLLSSVPDYIISKYSNDVLKTAQVFTFIIGFVVFVLLVFVLFIRINNKRVKEKEIEIKYREQLFGALASNTDDVFIMFSVDDFEVEYVSPNVSRVLGIDREQVKAEIEAISPDDEKYKFMSEIKQGEYISNEGERIHHKTGEHRWFVETVYRVTIDNSDRFIAILADCTVDRHSRQILEEALENSKAANEAKSTFLSNMSHDIRTPMHTIIGITTLLGRDADNPEKVREHTSKIAASSRHLLGLINDILDMSKMESGKTSLNITEISLPEIIDEVAAIIRPQTKAKNQQFDISVHNIIYEQLMGDKLRINQILINILSNAVKYTPDGGKVELSVSQLPQDKKNYAHLRFTVKDNGIGMSEKYLKVIFDPFTREESSLTNKVQGTGLGMPITKNIVDLMGGVINVESRIGYGSTFTVELELRIRKQDVDKGFWKKYGLNHILVIDDNVDICRNIVNTMSDTGIVTEYAHDIYTAVNMIEESHNKGKDYNIVLLNWEMNNNKAYETADYIRSIIPENISVMAYTDRDWAEIEDNAYKLGIKGFMNKPFFLSNFKQAIENMYISDNITSAKKEKPSILKGKHFLSAEDNELNAEILSELLDMKGADCVVAKNGKEAVEMFENSKPDEYDAILMDVQMPVMNGYEAAKTIRHSSHPDSKDIPIIAMTANAFADDIQDSINAGMNAHIAKPIDMSQLETVMENIFKER